MYAVMSRSVRARLAAGTLQVTAVGMFAGGGFAIAPPTLASLVVVGGGPVSGRALPATGSGCARCWM
jgi:hypothetical protein